MAAQPVSIGRATVDVRGGDVAGVTVVIRQGTDVRGKLVIDGKPAAAAVRVSLQPADSSKGMAVFDQVGRFQPAIEPDGSFLIPVVPQATYRLQPVILDSESAARSSTGPRGRGNATPAAMAALPLLPASAYVADIRQGGTSVYDNGILISPGSSDPIEVVINTNGGTVSGTVARVGTAIGAAGHDGRVDSAGGAASEPRALPDSVYECAGSVHDDGSPSGSLQVIRVGKHSRWRISERCFREER